MNINQLFTYLCNSTMKSVPSVLPGLLVNLFFPSRNNLLVVNLQFVKVQQPAYSNS